MADNGRSILGLDLIGVDVVVNTLLLDEHTNILPPKVTANLGDV